MLVIYKDQTVHFILLRTWTPQNNSIKGVKTLNIPVPSHRVIEWVCLNANRTAYWP